MKKILFCGGGSAGHVIPNIALIHDLKDRYVCEYAVTDGIERDICMREGLRLYPFDGVKLVRGSVIKNITLPVKLARAVRQCKIILRESRPDALFCKGGYASLPPAIAAKRAGIPIFTHESDITAGLANKIISRMGVKTFTSFEETAAKFKNGMYTGSPLRTEVISCGRTAEKFFTADGRKTVLVFGGGSGSRAINDAIHKIAPILCRNYNVIHVCGKGNVTATNIDGYRQYEFIRDMGAAYAAAGCAVARSGSNSAFELIANKIPTVFIPLENRASRGDQLKNAEYFYKKGLCHILRQRDLTAEALLKAIEDTLDDVKLYNNLKACTIRSANAKIIAEISKFLDG